MRKLETVELEAFNDTRIEQPVEFEVVTPDGRTLDRDDIVGNIPAVTSEYDGLTHSQMALASLGSLPQWDERLDYPVGRIDTHHARNLEVTAERVHIADEHGQMYKSLCVKGSDFRKPEFMQTETAARGYIIRGLQESLVMERIIRASNVLRANHVSAEYICGLVMPTTFPLPDNDLGIDSHKLITLPPLIEHLAAQFASNNPEEGKTAFETKAAMIDMFKDSDYLITLRAMGTPYRARDIADPTAYEKLRKYMLMFHDFEDEAEQTELESIDQQDYLARIFAQNLGSNVAAMHNAGVAHGFLTEGNISALGEIVDLDSCTGKTLELGDPEITRAQKVNDLVYSMQSIAIIVEDLGVSTNEQREVATSAFQNFLVLYFEEYANTETEAAEMLAHMLVELAKRGEMDKQMIKRACFSAASTYLDFITEDRAHVQRPLTIYPPQVLEKGDIHPYIEMYEKSYLPPKFYKTHGDTIEASLERFSEKAFDNTHDKKYSNLIIELARLDVPHMLMRYPTDVKGELLDPKGLLAYVSYMSGLRPKTNEELDNFMRVHDDSVANVRSFMDYMAKGNQPLPVPLQGLCSNNPELRELVGQLDLSAFDWDVAVPAIFTETDVQYEYIKTYFGCTEDTQILATGALSKIDIDDCVFIAELDEIYNNHLIEEQRGIAQFGLLFNLFEARRPGIVISGISSGKPKIYVLTSQEDSEYQLHMGGLQAERLALGTYDKKRAPLVLEETVNP